MLQQDLPGAVQRLIEERANRLDRVQIGRRRPGRERDHVTAGGDRLGVAEERIVHRRRRARKELRPGDAAQRVLRHLVASGADDGRAASNLADNQPVGCKLAVGVDHRRAVDAEHCRKPPLRREARPRRKLSAVNPRADLVADLQVERHRC